MRGTGLPLIRSARLMPKQRSEIQINAFVHSNAIDSGSATETLIIDGETRGLELNIRYGITKQLEASLATRWLRHSAGGLDSLIDGWHDAFGLSDGDRPLFAQDQFEFRYQQGEQQTRLVRAEQGLSDTELGLAYELIDSNAKSISLRAALNLPTGDADKATGSDKLDANIGLAASGHFAASKQFSWAAYAAYHYTGDDELFGIQTKQNAWVASADVAWRASERWQWQAQLSGHSALFESDIDELDDAAWQFSLASEYRFGNKPKTLRLYFSEDISVNAAPDFALGMSITFGL